MNTETNETTKPLRVFRMNECDWYVAQTIEGAKAACAAIDFMTVDEAESAGHIKNPYEESIHTLLNKPLWDEDREKIIGNWADELARYERGELIAPNLFASTEW